MPPTLKKVLKWTALTLGSVIIGIPLLLLVINAFDQNLKPEAVAFADLSDDNVPDKDNGYYAWVGLAAPVNENPHATGVRVVTDINQRLSSGPPEIVDGRAFLGDRALKLPSSIAGLCGRDETGCLDRYRGKQKEVRAQLRENNLLIERYARLSSYPEFRETILPRFFAPFLNDPAVIAGLARARNALLAINGDIPDALQRLRNDNLYWRRILQQSRGLVTRMIAVASIQRNTQIVSEIVASQSMSSSLLDVASQATRPLTAREWDLTKVYRNEFAVGMTAFADLHQFESSPCQKGDTADCVMNWAISTFLFKPNSTINLHYRRFQSLAETSRLPAQQWLAANQRMQLELTQDPIPFVWHIFYNPVGKILTAIAVPAYFSYSGRIHNLDGFLRLVSLQIAAKQAGVRAQSMAKLLANSAPELHNPYTGEPMQWDAQTRALYFNGYNEKSDAAELLSKRIEVRL